MKTLFVSAFLAVLLIGAPLSVAQAASAGDLDAANRLFAAANYRKALALYQSLLAAPPDSVSRGDIQGRIGDTYFRLGDFRSALDSYRMAIRDENLSDKPQVQYWIGFCCFLVGRDAEAVQELVKVPRLYPEAAMWGATAYYWAGRASERMGKMDQAAKFYRKAGGKGHSTQARFARKRAEAARRANTGSRASKSN